MKSINLTEIAANPKAIQELYKIEPRLDQIEVMQIVYDRDGPRIIVRFDLPEFPSVPPEKWKSQGFNRVQVQISLIGVRRVDHAGWAISNVAKMSFITTEAGEKVIHVQGETTNLEASFEHLNIDKVSAYKNVA